MWVTKRVYWFGMYLLLIALFSNYTMAQDTMAICRGESVGLLATPGADVYQWEPTYGINRLGIFNPKARPLVSTTYIALGYNKTTENLILNGNFSEGLVGLSTDYVVSNASTSVPGEIKIDDNSLSFTYQSAYCRQPSGEFGPMLLVDSSMEPDASIWCQEVEVVPNTDYLLSTFATNLVNVNHGKLQFFINGDQVGNSMILAKVTNCEWYQFTGYWNSGANTLAEICIENKNTIDLGNDLAIDSIEFFGLQRLSADTFSIEVLPSYEVNVDTAICEGTSLYYHGEFLEPGVSRTFALTTKRGCDSIVNISVGLTDELYQNIRIDTLCTGDNLDVFGANITRDTFICKTYNIAPTCDSTVCIEVVFLDGAALIADIQEASCSGYSDGSISVTPTAGFEPYIYNWLQGGSRNQIENLTAGTYTISVTDGKGCTASKAFTLVDPLPVKPELEAVPTNCHGEASGSIQLEATGGTAPYIYAMGELGFAPRNFFADLQAGTYSVEVQDVNGCMANASITITEPPRFQLYLPADYSLNFGDRKSIRVSTNASESISYEWSPAEGLSCIDCPNPWVTPADNTAYRVVATNEQGCIASGEWNVFVEKNYNAYLPNAFSPNDDGRNDRFQLFAAANVESVLSFQVFNRWGVQVFNASGCSPNDSTCGWDGDFNGKPAEMGIYLYAIQTQFIDGEVRAFEGEVLLIR